MASKEIVYSIIVLVAVCPDDEEVVEVLWDQGLSEQRLINAHPMHNAATVTLTVDGLFRLFEATEHEPTVVDLESLIGV